MSLNFNSRFVRNIYISYANSLFDKVLEKFEDVPRQSLKDDVAELLDSLVAHGLVDEVN